MINNQNVPKLRFKEFSGEWEEKKLGEVVEIIGGGTPETSKEEYWNGNIQWFTPTEIKSDYVTKSLRTISELGLKKSSAKILPIGAILLTTRATIGEVAIALNECATNQGFQSLVVKNNNNNIFIFNWIKTHKYELTSKANGSTFPEISKSEIEKITIQLPSSLEEQTKIANFLTAIDTKIDQLTKKQTLLKQYKKGVMQKLFSQKLRFKADDGSEFSEWEEKKIADVLKIGSGKDYKHLQSGDIPVFGTGGYMASVNEYLYDGESVCIGRKGTIDKPMYFNGKFWTVDTLFYTHSFKQSIPKFIYAIFLQINWKQYSEASGVPSLSKSTIENIQITIPSSLEEQTKIANFLTAIDTKIDLATKQLDATKQFKKALLQQMFV
jgi:type I restriction enzyme S subunit